MKIKEVQRRESKSAEIDSIFGEMGIQLKDSKKEFEDLKKEAVENDLELKDDTEDIKELKNISLTLTDVDRDFAVRRKLVPEHYRNVKFDENKIKSNLVLQNKKSNGLYTIYNFNKYIEVCNEIISTLRMGQIPRRSWIIGAPNGFGKSSFVNECLMIMNKHGLLCAPYISLHELAEIRVAEEQRLMRPFSYKATQGIYNKEKDDFLNDKQYYNYTNSVSCEDIIKKPNIVQSAYSWSEYINAECLFVHFTDVVSKDLESHVLYQLLSIRGAKGLPTIVMISTALEPYIKDMQLRELVWNEILAIEGSDDSYDRVIHISCYKRKSSGIQNKEKTIDMDTGVVY